MAAIIEKLSDSRAEAREWELRCDMAAVFRIGARLGWNEHIGNHNSLMLPNEAEPRFLINPRGYLFQELKASDLIVCDLEGRVLRGSGCASFFSCSGVTHHRVSFIPSGSRSACATIRSSG